MERVQFTVRLPDVYIRKLIIIANENSRTLNGELIRLIRRDIALFEKENGAISMLKEGE